MEQIQLSERLTRIAENIPENSRIADIGSDHAYLPVWAVLHKNVPYAVAGEVNTGPFESAKRTVTAYHLDHKIHVRKGNGLEVIEKDEVDVITIAGMGGSLIQSILQQGILKLGNQMSLILQPNVGAPGLRKWLMENHWGIVGEAILEEDGHIYEMLKADKIDGIQTLTEEELLMGPYLLKEKEIPVFQKKWRAEYEKIKKILDELNKSTGTSEINVKKETFQQQLALIERNLK